ncbi:MAG: M48 family metalloprotease [Proteobacteria bacterium]|nr:M48 family metalloprotease [Pseudomonadota bacterium]
MKFRIIFTLIYFYATNSFADASLIRDAETEKFLHQLADPIFVAADLNPQNIKIYIVNDDSINAFVSGGQNVFINTGLIRKYKTPDALIGVIAHETGHITAGHLARSSEGAEQAEGAMLLSYLLGIGAVAAGSPEAGTALIMGGNQTAQRLYMKFTRTQEEAADQHAIAYLDKLKYPATGLINLLEFFESEMIGYKDQIDEYLLSHPISRKRIDVIKIRTAEKKFSQGKEYRKINQKLQKPMDRVLAKLEAFIENPDYLLKKYQNRQDENSNYIKSVALFKKGKIDESLALLDPIIAKNPSDGFLFELKGQILFESGRIQDSVLTYSQAVKSLSAQDNAIVKVSFALAILSLKTSDQDLIKLAIKELEEAKKFEAENPLLFKQLANGYSRIGDEARSLLALAEFSLLIGEKEKCQKYAKEAKEKFNKSDKSEIIRADDLLELAKEKDGEKNNH